jgi:hypothetical protein
MNTTTYPNITRPAGTYPVSDYPMSDYPVSDNTYRYQVAEQQHRASDVERPAEVRYWVGAALTAVIAALTGLIGLVVAQGILGVSVLLGSGSALTPINVAEYGLAGAAIALLAAGLFAGMIRIAPKPAAYFGWLAGLVTVLATLLPFTTTATLHSQLALAAINLAVGLVIAVGIPLAASNARS